jgi:hypothetical protein
MPSSPITSDDGSSTTEEIDHGHSQQPSERACPQSDGPDAGHGLAEADLQSFADRFRSLVGQVSQEIQAGMRLSPSPESISPGSVTPPLHRVLDTHQPYMSLNEFGLPIANENIAVFGRPVRRMPTIESVGSHEAGSMHAHSPGATSIMTMSSRPPTRQTTHSHNSRASPLLSQPPSRSNSLHNPPSRSNSLHSAAPQAPPRMASELGDYVLAAVRRPSGSLSNGSSFVTAATTATPSGTQSTSGSGTTVSRSDGPPSRRNSVHGALSPVSEHEALLDEAALGSRLADELAGRSSPEHTPQGNILTSERRTESPLALGEFGERAPDGGGGGGGTGDSDPSSAYYSVSSGSSHHKNSA